MCRVSADLGTGNVSRVTYVDSAGAAKKNGTALRFVQNSGFAGWIAIYFEDVSRFAGDYYTLSFDLKSTAPITFGGAAWQTFGSGGSAAVAVDMGVVIAPAASDFSRYSLTFQMPSIAGKTLGAGHCGNISFYLTAGVADWQIANVKLERGSLPTAFVSRSFLEELTLCQRYYEIVVFGGRYWGTGISTTIYEAAPFKVQKRAAPTITLPPATNAIWNATGGGATPTIWSAGASDLVATISASYSAAFAGIALNTLTASAEL